MFGFFKTIADAFFSLDNGPDINPATGLPMVDATMDVQGNPYGFDSDSIFDSNNTYMNSNSWE